MNFKGNFDTYRSEFQFSSVPITSVVLNFTLWPCKKGFLTNTCLALHYKGKLPPIYRAVTFPNVDTSKNVRRNSHNFAKCSPDLLSRFSLRQWITSHAVRLLLVASTSLGRSVASACSWHRAAQAQFCFLLLNHRCSISSCFQLEQLSRLVRRLYYLF